MSRPAQAKEPRQPLRPAPRSRRLSAPLLSAALLATWLMLAGSLAPGAWALGALFAFAIPALTHSPVRGAGGKPRAHALRSALGLGARLLADIVRSNLDVARRVLGPEAAIRPRFVQVPLALHDPHAVFALACIVTLTPGTVSSALSADRQLLLVHALHCPDDAAAAALVAAIKARYEAPLAEIFE